MIEEIDLTLEDLGELDFDARRVVVAQGDLEYIADEFIFPVLMLEEIEDAS